MCSRLMTSALGRMNTLLGYRVGSAGSRIIRSRKGTPSSRCISIFVASRKVDWPSTSRTSHLRWTWYLFSGGSVGSDRSRVYMTALGPGLNVGPGLDGGSGTEVGLSTASAVERRLSQMDTSSASDPTEEAPERPPLSSRAFVRRRDASRAASPRRVVGSPSSPLGVRSSQCDPSPMDPMSSSASSSSSPRSSSGVARS